MYTIILKKDNRLVTTQRTDIMQFSHLVDKIQILVPKDYNGIDLSTSTVCYMEYISPETKKYHIEKLTLENNNYRTGYELQYLIPVTSMLTRESGTIKFQLSFINTTSIVQEGEDSETTEAITEALRTAVRKTKLGEIIIHPTLNWIDNIMGDGLTTLVTEVEKVKKDTADLKTEMVSTLTIDTDEKKLYLENSKDEVVGNVVDLDDIVKITTDEVFGDDPDGTVDGITDLDEAERRYDELGGDVIDLDSLVGED